MKCNVGFPFLLALLLPVSSAVAQTRDLGHDLADNEVSTSISMARCQYTPSDQACAGTNGSDQAGRGADDTLAQLQRRAGPPMRSRGMVRYPRGYRSAWAGPDGRHVVIGAVIGFGIGAALGAKAGSNQPAGVALKASLGIGAIGGLIGAAIGAGPPPFYARNRHQRVPWREKKRDDEDQMAGQVGSANASGN
jgi:hypothetical protein